MDIQTDIKIISDFERQFSQVSILMEDVVFDVIREWFFAFANSNGIISEMLLCSVLVLISVFIGSIIVRFFGLYEEKGNFFMVVVVSLGIGKILVCQKGCIESIVKELENKIEVNVVIDEILISGLFNYFLVGFTVFILCVDEVYLLLNKLIFNIKFIF